MIVQVSHEEVLSLVRRAAACRPTCAELLKEVADAIHKPEGILILPSEAMEDWQLARAALSVKMEQQGVGFLFRAIIEDWTYSDLVRELY